MKQYVTCQEADRRENNDVIITVNYGDHNELFTVGSRVFVDGGSCLSVIVQLIKRDDVIELLLRPWKAEDRLVTIGHNELLPGTDIYYYGKYERDVYFNLNKQTI